MEVVLQPVIFINDAHRDTLEDGHKFASKVHKLVLYYPHNTKNTIKIMVSETDVNPTRKGKGLH